MMTFGSMDFVERPSTPVCVSAQTKERAIRALLGENISPEVFEKLSCFIDSQFKKLNCCVLYSRNEKFRKLLTSLHLDVGKKEVIITNKQEVLFSKDYNRSPTFYA